MLPHSLAGKQAHDKVASDLWPITHFFSWRYLFLLPTLLLIFLMAIKDKKRPGILIAAFVMLYLLAYLAAGIDFYEWYIVPLMPVFAALFALSLEPLEQRRILYLGAAAFFLLVNTYYCYRAVTAWQTYINDQEVNRVIAGKWLNNNVSPDASIEMGAIGHIGWHFRGTVIDLSRLVTTFDNNTRGELMMTGQPNFADPTFQNVSRGYEIIKSFPHPIGPVYIWMKKDKTYLACESCQCKE